MNVYVHFELNIVPVCLFIKRYLSLDNSTINKNWTDSMGLCKENGTYLAGNISLSNVNSSCLGHVHATTPRWIGVFREKYLNTDQGSEFKRRLMINILYGFVFKNSDPKFCWMSLKLS